MLEGYLEESLDFARSINAPIGANLIRGAWDTLLSNLNRIAITAL